MHDKIVLLVKSKLNSIEVLLSKALINSAITLNEFILINNVLKEYNEMKEEIKNVNTSSSLDFSPFVKQCYHIV